MNDDDYDEAVNYVTRMVEHLEVIMKQVFREDYRSMGIERHHKIMDHLDMALQDSKLFLEEVKRRRR
jgi:hypothetical protein